MAEKQFDRSLKAYEKVAEGKERLRGFRKRGTMISNRERAKILLKLGRKD